MLQCPPLHRPPFRPFAIVDPVLCTVEDVPVFDQSVLAVAQQHAMMPESCLVAKEWGSHRGKGDCNEWTHKFGEKLRQVMAPFRENRQAESMPKPTSAKVVPQLETKLMPVHASASESNQPEETDRY